MLNNPFRYLRRKWKSNRPTTTCIVFGTACFACRVAAAYAVRPMRNRIPRASPRRVPGRNPRPAIGSAPSRYCGSALPCDPSLAGVYPFPVKIASGLRSCPPRHLVAEHNITNTIPLNSQRNRLPLNSLRRRVPTSDSRIDVPSQTGRNIQVYWQLSTNDLGQTTLRYGLAGESGSLPTAGRPIASVRSAKPESRQPDRLE